MPFSVSWATLIEAADDLPPNSMLITPLSNKRFRITDVQQHRIVIEREESGDSRPLQREQFESLYHRIDEAIDGFDLENIPPGAEPYAAVLSLHPRYEVDEKQGIIRETQEPTSTQVIDQDVSPEEQARTEPDVSVYSDALLLIDLLEQLEIDALEDAETSELINLYTLLSDVQRGANDLRQQVADVLLDRLHHDRPVAGQYGSVQRTTRRNRSLKDEEAIVEVLAEVGIDQNRVMGIDREKLDQVLEVTTLSESDVYEIEEREYVRKAEVDEDVKESRLQGLKDRLAASEDEEADALRQEIEELEARIEELTEFKSGQAFHTPTESES